MERKRRFDMAKDKPIAFYLVGTSVEDGKEEWLRTAYLPGFSYRKVMEAVVSGEPMEGMTWRKVPVRYRVTTEYGQRFRCVWDPAVKGFRTMDGALIIGRKWCKKIEEIIEDAGL